MRSAAAGWWRPLLVLALCALVVRVVLYVVWVHGTPGFGDFGFYHEQAQLLAQGRGWLEPYDHALGVDHPSAAHPPLWSLLLALPALVGLDSVDANRLTGAVVGCLVVVLVALVAARLGGRRAGLVAGALAVVSPVLVGADLSLLSESLYGVFVLLCLAAALEVTRRAEDRAGLGWTIAAGVAGGLSALTRGEGGLLAVLVIAGALLASRATWRRRGALLVVGVVATGLTIAPWTVRNEIQLGGFVPVSTNDSTVLAGANCASTYAGDQLGGWDLTCIRDTQRPYRDERVLADEWRRDGLHYARTHLGRLLLPVAEVRVLRTFALWHPFRMTQFAEGQPRALAKVSTIAYYLLVPFALLGAWRLGRRRGPWQVLAAVVVAIVVTSALGWGVPRFRHPVDLVMLIAAGCAVGRGARADAPPGRDQPLAPDPVVA